MEDVVQDVNVESPQESSPEASPSPAVETQPQQTPQAVEEQHVPYARFKETIEAKNEAAKQAREFELQVAKLQAQVEMYSKQNQPKAQEISEPAILKELDQVNPEFAKLMREALGTKSTLAETQKQLQELAGWKQSYEQNALRSQYESTLGKLEMELKVPDQLKAEMRDIVEAQIRRNPSLGLQDLPALYKARFDNINGYVSSREREVTAKYVTNKTKDAAAPAIAKGAPAGLPVEKFSANPREAKEQIVARALAQIKASKNI